MDVDCRPEPARAADAATIRRMVRDARLNPFDLDWRRFLVLRRNGRVIAAAQLRPPHAGWRELASVVVDPAQRGRGYGRCLVRAWQQRSSGPLLLHCAADRESFYLQCGFRRAEPAELPPRERRVLRLADLLTAILPSRYHLRTLCWYPVPRPQTEEHA
jgi:N-acetylglutamate synthase-like GNAT family acetyltransferase